MKTDTKIRLLFLALAVVGWLAITKNAHGQQAPTPPAATETQKTAVYVKVTAEDEVGQDVAKGFLANAGETVDVKLNDPAADADDAVVFHIMSNTVDGNPSASTILFVALKHVKGSDLLLYVGGLGITTNKDQEAATITGLSQLASQVFGYLYGPGAPDFDVTILPKNVEKPLPPNSKPSSYKRDKSNKS